jgi:hypothetical protein
MKGGGTDDTAALQVVLDRAANGRPVHLVIDGVALVSGLNVYGRTTVECTSGGGLYLSDGSSRSIIRNAHRSRDAIVDEHITIRGCFLNGNRFKNPGAHPELEPGGNNQAADNSFIAGIELLGVNYVSLESVILWSIRAFGAHIGNASHVIIRNVTVDHGGGPDVDQEYLQTDGLHFKGPLRYVTIDGIKLRTGDDAIAFNADDGSSNDLAASNEWGPYVRSGPITDVFVNNVELLDSLFGFRFLSREQRIDRVVINNVVGTINGPRLFVANNWIGPGSGNIGAIEFDGVYVDRSKDAKFTGRLLSDLQALGDHDPSISDGENRGEATFFNIVTHIESLTIRNFRTRVKDGRSIIRLGGGAAVGELNIDMNLLDPDLQALPLKLDKGAHIGRLNLALDWLGKETYAAKNPIVNMGGNIGELRWMNTPPRFVSAELMSDRNIVVTFSQEVKASDFRRGVRIQANGAPVRIARTRREANRTDQVHFILDTPLRTGSTVTWSYAAPDGDIQNLSGDDLVCVSERTVDSLYDHGPTEEPATTSSRR